MPIVALLLAVLVPAALFGWIAWKERSSAMQAAATTALRSVAVLREHALRIFQGKDVLIRQIEEELAGRSWIDIENDARLHRRLADMVAGLDVLNAIVLVDADGYVRLSSRQFPAAKVAVEDRDYFQAHKDGAAQLVIGSQIVGRTSNERSFTVSKARSAADGSFDGVIAMALSLDHFTSFWRQFAPTVAHVIPMIRADGELIVRYPSANNPQRLRPGAPFMQHIARSPESGLYTAISQVDGIERLNAYSRIGDYPVYVSFSMETRRVLQAWQESMLPYALFTAMAILALLAMSTMLIRLGKHHHEAAERWRETANRLQAEMDRRQAAEERLRQAQKMEIVGQITGGVAHDFNNLLQILSSNLTLAERTIRDEGPRAFIKGAFQAVERAANLTKQLLAFSRRQPLNPEPIDMVQLVHDMSGLLRTTLGAAVKLNVESGAETQLAMADRHQAEMAILNLAVNARDAMPDGGTLAIRVSNIRHDAPVGDPVCELRAGEYVAVSVIDTGTGMPADVRRRAFEPFFTTKATGKGSGLGLSQVQGFAGQSGGGVQIESEAGRGTTVTLLLPRASESQTTRAEDSRAAVRFRGEREAVLIVDDDDDVRHGIAANLEAHGYEVIQAASAARALEILRQRKVQLLISDYAMPGMKGSELIRLARAAQPALKTLLITGFADLPSVEQTGIELLRKPFRADELAARVRSMLPREGHPPTVVQLRANMPARPGGKG